MKISSLLCKIGIHKYFILEHSDGCKVESDIIRDLWDSTFDEILLARDLWKDSSYILEHLKISKIRHDEDDDIILYNKVCLRCKKIDNEILKYYRKLELKIQKLKNDFMFAKEVSNKGD